MVFAKACFVLAFVSIVTASSLEEARTLCASSDPVACLKYKFLSFLDSAFQKDTYKLSEDVEIIDNGYRSINEARSALNFEDVVEKYIQSHDVTFKLPLDSSIAVSSRDLNNNILHFKLKFSPSKVDEGRGKKKKLKKIMIPIAVLLLMKGLTLIPLILGILGIKTWNALQLSFITFITSFGMAIYDLSKKFASDHPPAIVAHDHWNAHHRSFDESDLQVADAQQMAYRAH